jgi:hypothetical protein
VNGLLIDGSVFQSTVSQVSPLLLDSVNNCNISNNTDITTASVNGSWQTKATFGPGTYNFSNNSWNNASPALYDTSSSYHFINDRGIVGRKKSFNAASGGTSLTINHGLFTAPQTVTLTPQGNANPGSYYVSTISSTQFVVNWANAGTPTWYWEADASR